MINQCWMIMVIGFGLSACQTKMTSLDTALSSYKQGILKKSRSNDSVGISCPVDPSLKRPVNPHNFAELSDVISIETFDDFRKQSLLYAKEVSDSPNQTYIGAISCWSGGLSMYADITDLKDPNMSWARLIKSTYGDKYGHKCFFSDNPEYFTTDICPDISMEKLNEIKTGTLPSQG